MPAGTPGMDIVRDIGTMAHPDASYGRPGNHAEIVFTRLPGAGRPPDRRSPATASCSPSSASAAAASTTRCAGSARPSARSTSCASGPSRATSHGKLLGQHQMIQDYIALSHMEIQAARLLTFQTAWKMDKYGASAVRAELGMVKAHVSKVVLAVLDRTIQVCGALGYSSDLPVEEWYRGTRFGPIGDGPDELHKSVLARTLLKGYQPVEGWPTEHIPSRRPAAENEVAAVAGRGGYLHERVVFRRHGRW